MISIYLFMHLFFFFLTGEYLQIYSSLRENTFTCSLDGTFFLPCQFSVSAPSHFLVTKSFPPASFDVCAFKMVSSWKRTPHEHVLEGNVSVKHVLACVGSVLRSDSVLWVFFFCQQKWV